MESKNRSSMVKKNFKSRYFQIPKIVAVLSLIGVWSFPAYGVGDAGMYGELFTYWGASARDLGMAGTLTGLADDASAGYFNPAGLVQLNTQKLTFMHSIVFAGGGTSAEVLSYSRPASGTSGFGATFIHLFTPGIQLAYNDRVRGGYKYTNREVGGLFTYSTRLMGPVLAGANAKIFYHQLYNYSGMGFGLDLGLFFFPAEVFSFGVNVQNVVKPAVKFVDETSSFPTVLRTGASIRPFGEKLAVTVDMIWSEYRSPSFGAGIEYKPFQMFHMRGGANQSFAGLGFGLWKDQSRYEVQLDYAFLIPFATGSMYGFGHNFSLSLMFGGFRAKASCPSIAFSPTSGTEGKNIAWLYFDVKPRTKVKKWQVLVKDEAGTVVRKIGAWGEPPYRVSWDGKDDNAILVPDGRYYYSLKVVETSGRSWDYEGYFSSLYTVGPPGTIIVKPKGETPKYLLEERRQPKETQKGEKRRKGRKRKKR